VFKNSVETHDSYFIFSSKIKKPNLKPQNKQGQISLILVTQKKWDGFKTTSQRAETSLINKKAYPLFLHLQIRHRILLQRQTPNLADELNPN